jgi:hypothetical protein
LFLKFSRIANFPFSFLSKRNVRVTSRFRCLWQSVARHPSTEQSNSNLSENFTN